MTDPEMVKTRGDGINIQLAVWEGKGKTILCVHGLTANCRCWDLIASELSPEFHVIAMDLRGRGLSDKPETGYSVEHHMGDIHALLEEQGIGPVTLLGHSLGAYMSLAFAARYPESVAGLILIDGGGNLEQDLWNRLAQAITPSLDRSGQSYSSFEDYAAALTKSPFLEPSLTTLEESFRYEFENTQGDMGSMFHLANIQEEIADIQNLDVSQLYPTIACPVLILRATDGIPTPDDVMLPERVADQMTQEIPNALSINIEETNHFSILFQPSQIRKKSILDFLRSIDNQGSRQT